nr:MAG TPA: hypothetical protein [Caudoviricetes sp.]
MLLNAKSRFSATVFRRDIKPPQIRIQFCPNDKSCFCATCDRKILAIFLTARNILAIIHSYEPNKDDKTPNPQLIHWLAGLLQILCWLTPK